MPFYKQMLSKKLTLQDIETIDHEFYNSLIWMRLASDMSGPQSEQGGGGRPVLKLVGGGMLGSKLSNKCFNVFLVTVA